ncbi:MAG: TetR family transcriptional regulator, partial [Mogibacterium sp.]|nr:TetR family transcriptional regulator [Mogibacterium sp.]
MSNSKITERAIEEAFLEILNDRPLSKISVKDITDRCGINRNTFYYHYRDVPELLERFCQNHFDNIVAKYLSVSSLDECLEACMHISLIYKKAIYHIYYSSCRETYVASLWRICEYVVSKYADTVFPDAPIGDRDRVLFIRFLKCSLFGIIVDWITTGM